SFAMPPFGIHPLAQTMCQHDFQGNRIFQHRNLDKWRLDGSNRRIDGFIDEDVCRYFLAQLQQVWSGRVHWNDALSAPERAVMSRVAGKTYAYNRIGYDSRPMELKADRTVGRGAAACERSWTIETVGGHLSLVLHGDDGPTCRLTLSDGVWSGRWYRFERMPITLTELSGR